MNGPISGAMIAPPLNRASAAADIEEAGQFVEQALGDLENTIAALGYADRCVFNATFRKDESAEAVKLLKEAEGKLIELWAWLQKGAPE